LPAMLKTVLPVFFDREEEASPQVVAWARALFGAAYQDKLLVVACLGLPVLFLARGVCSYLNRYLMNHAGFVFLDGLRRQVFGRLQELPLAFYQQHKSGDLASRLLNDTEQLKNVVVMVSGEIIKQPLTLIFAIGFLAYLSLTERSVLFALVALFSLPICIIPIRMVTRRLIKKARLLTQQTGELAAVVTESLQAPMEIQAYNLQEPQLERFRVAIRDIFRLSMKTVKYQSLAAPIIEFLSACGMMAALYYGVRHGMDLATFSALGLALYLAYEPVKKLSILHAVIKAGTASLERLEYVLDAADSVPNPARPRPLSASPADVSFEQVCFTYATRTADAPPALDGINVRVRPGEIVALVGPSGAGKSTFVSLIPRFYDPTAGRVALGGVDLREADKAALRQRIAVVPQMPALFNASVAHNIRLGRAGATEEEVLVAARRAYVTDFIASLPRGFDTVVGERGAALSGGQRQRIAIARAFLKDAPILILDEATSALDAESEARVQQALRELLLGRTTFLIAHRFSSISLATRVLVFEEGRITGDGPAETLARTHAAFRRMSELQRLG
jgi:subfamily B ATP-binding cassette protein MsbA